MLLILALQKTGWVARATAPAGAFGLAWQAPSISPWDTPGIRNTSPVKVRALFSFPYRREIFFTDRKARDLPMRFLLKPPPFSRPKLSPAAPVSASGREQRVGANTHLPF